MKKNLLCHNLRKENLEMLKRISQNKRKRKSIIARVINVKGKRENTITHEEP